MDLTRRRFLAAAPVAFTGTLGAGSLLAALEAHSAPLPDLSDWDAVRAQFALDPALRALRQLLHRQPSGAGARCDRSAGGARWTAIRSTSSSTACSRTSAQRAAARCRPTIAQLPRRARGGCRADPQHDRRPRAGLPRPAAASAGDEVVVTTHDHYSHHESIRLATERARRDRCARSRCSTTRRPRRVDSLVDRTCSPASGRRRAWSASTWVHSSTGMRLPIREMAQALKAKHPDVLLVVDGVHGIGAVDETIATMGAGLLLRRHAQVDVRAARHRAWCGPTPTTGRACARPCPTSATGSRTRPGPRTAPPKGPTNAARMTPGGFHAFEHQWAMRPPSTCTRRWAARAWPPASATSTTSAQGSSLAGQPKIHVHTPHSPATCPRAWWRSRSTG